ncbi:MAG: NUDIX hydrolase [Lawsonella clevelandensis]
MLRNMRRAYNPHTNRVYLSAVKVALIGRTDRRGRLLWSLPKGHIEDYETVPMTAVREVREETGIEGEIIKHLGTIDYWFLSDGKRIHKTVHHYLAALCGRELSNADAEISEVKWVSMKDLPAHLSYADERKLARRATGVVAAWIRSEYGSGDGTGETIQIEGEYPDDDILGDDLDEDDLLEPSYDEQNSSQGSAHHNGQTSAQNNGQNSGQRRNRRGRRRGGKRNRPAPPTEPPQLPELTVPLEETPLPGQTALPAPAALPAQTGPTALAQHPGHTVLPAQTMRTRRMVHTVLTALTVLTRPAGCHARSAAAAIAGEADAPAAPTPPPPTPALNPPGSPHSVANTPAHK